MKKAIITMSLGETKETAEFPIEEDTKEYIVADEAYRRALIFANVQAIKYFGHLIPVEQLSSILQNVNYEYKIMEV